MNYFIIGSAAFLTSLLTLFSGFGLGTLLMPVFALFFPVEIAIAMTAIVHFLNNLFKLGLFGRRADIKMITHFGIPAIAGSFVGAFALIFLSDVPAIFVYIFANHEARITAAKLIVSIVMVLFAIFELMPRTQNKTFDQKYLKIGGFLSGFFGGISGNQGALRSAFLIKCDLAKEAYIGTGVVIACLVDMTRLGVYSSHLLKTEITGHSSLILFATGCAFFGAWLGGKWLKKITVRSVQLIVVMMLIGIALALGSGII